VRVECDYDGCNATALYSLKMPNSGVSRYCNVHYQVQAAYYPLPQPAEPLATKSEPSQTTPQPAPVPVHHAPTVTLRRGQLTDIYRRVGNLMIEQRDHLAHAKRELVRMETLSLQLGAVLGFNPDPNKLEES
jgi:hypothetical protein